MTNPDEDAFPLTTPYTTRHGLTKREWFAGMALCGLNSKNGYMPNAGDTAAKMADDLITALNK